MLFYNCIFKLAISNEDFKGERAKMLQNICNALRLFSQKKKIGPMIMKTKLAWRSWENYTRPKLQNEWLQTLWWHQIRLYLTDISILLCEKVVSVLISPAVVETPQWIWYKPINTSSKMYFLDQRYEITAYSKRPVSNGIASFIRMAHFSDHVSVLLTTP